MHKIIVAGHICLDITPVFPAGRNYRNTGELLEPGKLVRMEGVDVHTGGCVANTGLALKKLGNDVRLLGKVGTDAFGDLVRNLLAGDGAGGLLADQRVQTSYSVVLALPGIDRVFLHAPGANDTFVSADIPDSVLEDAQLLHFGYPSVMKKMYENDGAELIDIFRRAKEKGLMTSLDFSAIDPDSEAGQAPWSRILKKVLSYVDFFVPSFEELCFMTERKTYDQLAAKGGEMTRELDMEKDVLPLAERMIAMGCRTVLIKCGTGGMVYKTASGKAFREAGLSLKITEWADKSGYQPCFRADAVRSATGAGDTSIAAFLTAVLDGKNPSECAALAAAQGACCVTAYDALSGVRPLKELEERIRAGWEILIS